MKNILLMFGVAFLFASCARMPYQQWNQELSDLEEKLELQKESSTALASGDVMLYNGVYNATKKKEAVPYPELGKIVGTIKATDSTVQKDSDDKLTKSEAYRAPRVNQSIKTRGSEWSDFQAVLNDLMTQSEVNGVSLESLSGNDQLFDSICRANKVQALPMLQYEVKLAEKMNLLEDEFNILSNEYQAFKRGITKREDPKQSMIDINRMKQKVRQIENEFHQLSNLYSRVSSLRADAMIYEGPYVSPMAEIKMITQKTDKIAGLIRELDKMVAVY